MQSLPFASSTVRVIELRDPRQAHLLRPALPLELLVLLELRPGLAPDPPAPDFSMAFRNFSGKTTFRPKDRSLVVSVSFVWLSKAGFTISAST